VIRNFVPAPSDNLMLFAWVMAGSHKTFPGIYLTRDEGDTAILKFCLKSCASWVRFNKIAFYAIIFVGSIVKFSKNQF
jgi:hypothetical protein